MSEYLIQMIYSEPKNANSKSRVIKKEIKGVDAKSVMKRVFDMVCREKFLDKSVIAAEIYLKFSAIGFFVFVGRINAKDC